MDLFSLFLFTHENNEIKSATKINDFTVYPTLRTTAKSTMLQRQFKDV